MIEEGKTQKGGVNAKPTATPPPPPKGQSPDRCPACGKTYTKHLGLNGTCRDLQATKALLREALGLLEEWPGFGAAPIKAIAWAVGLRDLLAKSEVQDLLARAGKGGAG